MRPGRVSATSRCMESTSDAVVCRTSPGAFHLGTLMESSARRRWAAAMLTCCSELPSARLAWLRGCAGLTAAVLGSRRRWQAAGKQREERRQVRRGRGEEARGSDSGRD